MLLQDAQLLLRDMFVCDTVCPYFLGVVITTKRASSGRVSLLRATKMRRAGC